jgi:hypothetical protein
VAIQCIFWYEVVVMRGSLWNDFGVSAGGSQEGRRIRIAAQSSANDGMVVGDAGS